MPIAHHVMLRLKDSRVIAPSTRARRLVARTVFRLASDSGLLAFRAVDTHLHLELACAYDVAKETTRRIEISLARQLHPGIGFVTPHIKPIVDQFHLRKTFRYVLDQAAHHGFDDDPFHEASNLPDLLGLRTLGRFTTGNVRALLPRVRREELLQLLGVETMETLGPGDPSLDQLVEAAAAAAALPDLRGRTREVVEARWAAIHAAESANSAELAQRLGLQRRVVQKIRARDVAEPLVRAVRLQLRWRSSQPNPDERLLADTQAVPKVDRDRTLRTLRTGRQVR